MMRSKNRFFWSDALYLARTKDLLKKVGEEENVHIYRCVKCSAFVKFAAETNGGAWVRVKPYEQFRLEKTYESVAMETGVMDEVMSTAKDRKLYRCKVCASHWWNDRDGWSPTDGEEIEHRLKKGEEHAE